MLDPTPHLERFESYESACREFRWRIPDKLNIADAVLSRHADAVTRVALVEVRPGGLNTYTYGGLDYLSDKFAMSLSQRGIVPGDSVAVVLPQSAAAIIAQLGALKLGAVAVPLSHALEAPALEFALKDSGARAVVVHHTQRRKLESNVSSLAAVFVVNKLKPEFDDVSPDFDFWRDVFEASADFAVAETRADSPAFFFYYSDSKGRLVRATHNHASLIHQLPAFEMSNNLQLSEDTGFWTPQDWASIYSSLCSIYPALWYGWRIVACESPDADSNRWKVMERCGVSSLFANRGEIDLLREETLASHSAGEFKLRNIVCRGLVSADVTGWAIEWLGASVSTVCCNALIGSFASSCNPWFEARPGSSGRAAPGFSIEVIDGLGRTLPAGSVGRVAILRADRQRLDSPTHQRNTVSDSAGDWIVSDDVGFKDEDGYFWPAGSS